MHRTLLNHLELFLYTDKVENLTMATVGPVDAINTTHARVHLRTHTNTIIEY